MRSSGSLIQSAAFVIKASDHFVDFVVEPFPPTDPAFALQVAMRGERPETPLMVPLIYTGVSSGLIYLAVEVFDGRAMRRAATVSGFTPPAATPPLIMSWSRQLSVTWSSSGRSHHHRSLSCHRNQSEARACRVS